MSEVTLDEVGDFVEMLTGKSLPEDMVMPDQPHLTRRQAFSVVWYLQVHLSIIPDHYEMCDICKSLFDTHCGGHIIDGTDDPDEWQRELGVTQEMLEDADGTMFCSSGCEREYWYERQKEKRYEQKQVP